MKGLNTYSFLRAFQALVRYNQIKIYPSFSLDSGILYDMVDFQLKLHFFTTHVI